MKRLMIGAVVGALMLGACATAPAGSSATSSWVGAWGASPAPPTGTGAPSTSATSPGRSFENQTVRQVIRVGAGGDQIRIRFTNEYGEKPLQVGTATVQLAGPDGAAIGAPVPVTFGGLASISIPRFSPMLSDPIALPVKALENLSVSLFFPQPTGPCTCHPLGIQTAFVSGPGDFTKTGFEATETFVNRAFVSAVEVQSAKPTRAIIAFGDSITDGYLSTLNADRRWPDVLAERLNATRQDRSVVNQAISGNRVQGYGLAMFGDPAVARFDRDVLTVPNAGWLVILEGINDIGQGGDQRPSAEVMIAGYQQIIARAKAHGLKVYGGTLLPYEGARYYTEAGEVIRQSVNTWIRSSGAFDAVIDFDAVMRDPASPKKMKAALQSGDWLHPNDAGYKVMGEAVDLGLFR